MIRTLIDIEKQRYARHGFGTIVSNEDISIIDTEKCVTLGNDTIIITGFIFDQDTNCGENERISVVSPTDSICDTSSNLASYGAGRLKVMKDYMIVKRQNSQAIDDAMEAQNYGGALPVSTQSPLTINFIRISPIKK